MLEAATNPAIDIFQNIGDGDLDLFISSNRIPLESARRALSIFSMRETPLM